MILFLVVLFVAWVFIKVKPEVEERNRTRALD